MSSLAVWEGDSGGGMGKRDEPGENETNESLRVFLLGEILEGGRGGAGIARKGQVFYSFLNGGQSPS